MSWVEQSKHGKATTGFKAIFKEQMEASGAVYDPLVALLSMETTSTGSEEQYNWFGQVPNMEELVGQRKYKQLRAEGQTVINKNYVNGITVKQDDIDDNKLGQAKPRIQSLAEAGKRVRYDLLVTLLNAAFTGLAYDGVAFCSDSHPNAGGTAQDNKLTPALSATSFETAVAQLMNIKDEENVFFRNFPTHLIVSPTNYIPALKIISAATLSTGGENVLSKLGISVVPLHGLTAAYWFVADLSKPLKPLLSQTRKPLSFAALDKQDDPQVFETLEYKYGAHWRGAAAYGMWELIVGSDGST